MGSSHVKRKRDICGRDVSFFFPIGTAAGSRTCVGSNIDEQEVAKERQKKSEGEETMDK